MSGILRGDGLPRWTKLECVVRVLSEWASHKPDPATVVLEVQELWLACRQSAKGTIAPTTGAHGHIEVADQAALPSPQAAGLKVLSEEARLSYDNGAYEVEIKRSLRNEGMSVISDYDVTIVVGRYPEEPERSREHHNRYPLTWSELAFEAWCDGRPVSWQAKSNLANRKEIKLLLENDSEVFSLRPGSSTTLSYSYRVLGNKWGNWFSRRALFPTDRLTIIADFPEHLRPVVWGTQVEPLMDEAPLHIPIRALRTPTGRLTYRWQLNEVVVRRSYRLEWGFRAVPHAISENM